MGRDDEGRPFVDLLESDLPTPDLPLESQELQVQVKTAVDELPSHLREILLLSYFQRMSYNQIAESLEIPLGTVKSRLHTAVATFASTWKALHEDDKDGGEE
jgi:RNA polymerase sigma-70 factor (ECF subfamily)